MTDLENLPDFEPVAPVEELDAAIADTLIPHVGRSGVRALGAISDLTDQEPLYAAGAATLVVAAMMRDGRTWRAGTRIVASHLLATGLRGIVKQMVDRTRPDAAAERGEYVLREGQRRETDFNSFPSGHTAGAVAVACAVGHAYPASRQVALGLAAAAGVAQVVRSRHYVTDVVAGAMIGWAADVLVGALIDRAEQV
nr:phosphatase PAP2 family protein [uncultured Sphingomonas sp.]